MDSSKVEKANAYAQDDGTYSEHASSPGVDVINMEARTATSKEHNLTVRQGFKAYPSAIMWSILLSSAVIMEGYDTILVRFNSAFLSS